MASTEEHILFHILEQCVKANQLSPQCQSVLQDFGQSSSKWKHFLIRAISQFEKQKEGKFSENVGLLSLLWVLRQMQGRVGRMETEIDTIGKHEGTHLLKLLVERLDATQPAEIQLFCELVRRMKQRNYFTLTQKVPLFESLDLVIKEEKWAFLNCLLQSQVFPSLLRVTPVLRAKEMPYLLSAMANFVQNDFSPSQKSLRQFAWMLSSHMIEARGELEKKEFDDRYTQVLAYSAKK